MLQVNHVIPSQSEKPQSTLSAVGIYTNLNHMLTWMSLAVMLTGSLAATIVKIRAHLLALYLWRKTRNLAVLGEVARFERSVR